MRHRLGTEDLTALSNSLIVSQRNEDLELYKTDIRVSKENQERDNTEQT